MNKLKVSIFVLGFVIMQASFWIYNTPIYVHADDRDYDEEWAKFAVQTTYSGVRNAILSKYTSLGEYAWMFDAAELGASQMIDYLINGGYGEGSSVTSVSSFESFVGLYYPKSDSPLEMLSYTCPPLPPGSFIKASSFNFAQFNITLDKSYNSRVESSSFVGGFYKFNVAFASRVSVDDCKYTFDSRFDPSSYSTSYTSSYYIPGFTMVQLDSSSVVVYPTWQLSVPIPYLSSSNPTVALSKSHQSSIEHNVPIDVSSGLSQDLIDGIHNSIDSLYPESGEEWFFPEYGEPIPTEPETVPKYNDLTYPGNIPDYTMPTYEMESHSIPESAISGAGFWFTQLQNFIENSGLMWLVVLVGLLTILFYLLRW